MPSNFQLIINEEAEKKNKKTSMNTKKKFEKAMIKKKIEQIEVNV